MSSSNKWTREQEAAIETSGCDLLVAAAAGSGKTAVLVERIIKKVTNEEKPIDIDRLLVVTFTNAAASEMRERIGDAISRELDISPDSVTFQRQLTLLPKASITTIHSFCLDVIRNNFHIISIDPNFRIADETETILLKQESIEELFDEKYEKSDNNDFLSLVESYGGNKSDEQLEEIVVDIYKFAESSPWPEKWLSDAAEDFNVAEDFVFEESKWAKYILKNIRIEITGLIANMHRAIEIIRENEELKVYLDNFQSEMEQLKGILTHSNISWNTLSDYLGSISFDRLKSCKNANEQLKKYVTDIRTNVKKRIKDIQSNIMGISEERIRAEMQGIYPAMKALADLVIDFKRIYREKKRERGIIDFNDIEHYALEILTMIDEEGNITPSDPAKRYQEKFEEVLVDEYQDSNLVQEVILTMVSRRTEEIRNLFMVGDVKQSIYRFRQAMPELFLKKYNEFDEAEGLQRKITLFKNFRSRKEVIEGTNYIFKQIMSENVGELNYTEREALNLGAAYPETPEEELIGGPIEINIIENEKRLEEPEDETVDDKEALIGIDDEEEDIDNIELEARLVVSRIKEIVEGNLKEYKVYDKGTRAYRKIEYRDIVILLRATKNWSNMFLDEFSRERIPAFADTGTGYFDTIEIKTILSLLQIIDNPIQDIPLLSVMRSPVFTFTPQELIDIRLGNEGISFYEALKLTAGGGISEIAIKVKEFLDKLAAWQQKSIYTPIDEFLWQIYMETGYFSYVSAMPGGVQRQANLKVLFERAKQYENTSYKGLFNFINFINKLKRNNGDMGSAKILGENENVVRIMSIHKSKGLEFPVVFVSGMGKGFNMLDLRKSILFHKELGFGPDFVDYKRRYSYSSTMKEAIKTRIRLETLSEEMRVLYVAFTRAKEKLIITGSVKNVDKAIAKWGHSSEKVDDKLSEYEVLNARTYLDWICPAIMNHRDGSILLEKGGIKAKDSLDTEGDWKINVWDRKTILGSSSKEVSDDALEESALTMIADENKHYSPYAEEVNERLGFIYPYEKANSIPAKLSVSELKRARNLELLDEEASMMFSRAIIKKPVFLEGEKGLSASEKGTLMHLVMQHINFTGTNTIEEIKKQIAQMVNSEIIREIEAQAINSRRIERFFRSQLGERLKNSKNVIRELPFSVEVSASNVYRDLPEDRYKNEVIMLQGVIDCFFEEDGEFVIIDYKTDYVEEGKIEEIKDRYELQLECYSRALEATTGKKVKEKYIYLFSNGEIIKY